MLSISVLVPVFNEVARLPIVVEALLHQWPRNFSLKEVVFVNDGSTDQTLRLLKQVASHLRSALNVKVKIISYADNRGKGYAVKQGMQAATSEWLLLTDVDMSTPFSELKKFVGKRDQLGDVVIGTRKNGHSTVTVAQPWHRQLLGRVFTGLARLILGLPVTDFTCGFKLFKREAYQAMATSMVVERWGYDAEILFLAKKNGFAIREVPVTWANDQRTKVSLLQDALRSLVDLLTIRLNDWRGIYTPVSARDTLKAGLLSWRKI